MPAGDEQVLENGVCILSTCALEDPNGSLPIDDGGRESFSINRSPQGDRFAPGVDGFGGEIGSRGDLDDVRISGCGNCGGDGWIVFRWYGEDVRGRITTLVGNAVFIGVGAG